MFDETGTAIILTSPSGADVMIRLEEVARAEARLHEVKIVNKGNAQELLASFNEGYLEASRALAHLKFEHNRAVRAADKRKAVVVLDVAPAVLQEKGLLSARSPAGSEDLRNAVINQDDEYLELVDRADYIKAAIEVVRGKQEALENAIIATRRALDNRDLPYSVGAPVIPESATAGMEISKNSFGNARYR